MTSTRKGGWGGLQICHVSADSIVFKQDLLLNFADGGGGGSQNWSMFADVINV